MYRSRDHVSPPRLAIVEKMNAQVEGGWQPPFGESSFPLFTIQIGGASTSWELGTGWFGADGTYKNVSG